MVIRHESPKDVYACVLVFCVLRIPRVAMWKCSASSGFKFGTKKACRMLFFATGSDPARCWDGAADAAIHVELVYRANAIAAGT